jgi:2-polyprenyl-3-methyl-5-hydroxy-6-metoxy-1,4-benzoquinol methylase
MIDLSRRQRLDEVMDDPALDPAIYARCIADLAKVNQVTMTHRPTRAWLARALRDWPKTQPFTLLDVAYGDGDLLRTLGRWAAKRGYRAQLSGVDLNPRSAIAARAATPPDLDITYHTGDVFSFTPTQRPDFIVTSQFTHHLDEAQLVALLRWIDATAQHGWLIADLHRHLIPYYGFRWLARLFGWHAIVRRDGTASIARSFRRADWQQFLADAGVAASIRWSLPFRYLITAPPDP